MRDPGGDFTSPGTLGEAFSRISALYFRGKLAYARHFGNGSASVDAVQVITPSRGLLPAGADVTPELLDEFASTPIGADEPAYREALANSLGLLSEKVGPVGEFVFLGSLATPKYTDVLVERLGRSVFTPEAFVGMGNMKRGSILLRAVEAGTPLPLLPLRDALAG